MLEINDSNALLLNPNQFSLTNPGSPGGTTGKRATRLRKDAEDLTLFPDGKKRKRNPGEDEGYPNQARRAIDTNSTTPLWQSEKARAAAKQNGPVYSIDKLFTDKELSMHYNKSNRPARRRSVHVCREEGEGVNKSNGKIADCETQRHATAADERQETKL